MPGLLIGYARVSTEEQDLTAQPNGPGPPGRRTSRAYVDHLAQSGLVPVSQPMSAYDPDRPGPTRSAGCRSDVNVATPPPQRHAEPRHS